MINDPVPDDAREQDSRQPDVHGDLNPDAVWYYPNPRDGAEMVRDRVAFWKGVQVE